MGLEPEVLVCEGYDLLDLYNSRLTYKVLRIDNPKKTPWGIKGIHTVELTCISYTMKDFPNTLGQCYTTSEEAYLIRKEKVIKIRNGEVYE